MNIIDFNAVVNKLSANLDLSVERSKIIASNIANVDTPGYKSKDLTFHRILNDSLGDDGIGLKRTHAMHMTASGTNAEIPRTINNEIVENPNAGRADGNNVNIDEEMLKLTKNNIQYNVSVQLLSKKLRQLHEAIDKSR